jgi:hypothetical protein
VPQEVGVNALRLEPGFLRQPTEDQKRSGSCQCSTLSVQEELRAVTAVEVGPAAGEIAP